LTFRTDAALLQFSRISTLPKANHCNVNNLRETIKRINRTGSLAGSGSQIWGSLGIISDPKPTLGELCFGLFTGIFKSYPERAEVENEFQEHLIQPREGQKQDGLTRWLICSFIPLYHYLWKYLFIPLQKSAYLRYKNLCSNLCRCGLPNCFSDRNEEKRIKRDSNVSQGSKRSQLSLKSASSTSSVEDNLTEYNSDWIVRATSIMTTVVACLLPTVAITILARVHSMGMILGLIAFFTSLFAFGLVLLSSASSRVEIFTATAA
jgi:hypothetical protein